MSTGRAVRQKGVLLDSWKLRLDLVSIDSSLINGELIMSIKRGILSLKPSVSRHLVAEQRRATAAKTTHDSYIEFRPNLMELVALRPSGSACQLKVQPGPAPAWPLE